MARDFTLAKYEELCRAIRDGACRTMTVRDYLRAGQPEGRTVILRHDVDRKPKNAVATARIERAHGLAATYYFRHIPATFKPALMKEIEAMGHEVGYHYETMAKGRGDAARAFALFREELAAFRAVCDIQTIAMHGSPLSPWDNRDLWQHYDFRTCDLLGETYLSLDYERLAYVTDTGRAWDADRTNLRDRVSRDWKLGVAVTDDVIHVVREGRVERLCIQTHPERWAASNSEWLVNLAKDGLVNQVKRAIRLKRQLGGRAHA